MTAFNRVAHDSGKRRKTKRAPKPNRTHVDRYADRRPTEMDHLLVLLAERLNSREHRRAG